jgi:hypothetical protein
MGGKPYAYYIRERVKFGNQTESWLQLFYETKHVLTPLTCCTKSQQFPSALAFIVCCYSPSCQERTSSSCGGCEGIN